MTPIRLRVAELRKAKGWSKSELSRQTGLTRPTIDAIEAGTSKGVDYETLEILADVFEIDPGLLIERISGTKKRR